MFTFLEMLALVESESSFGAYVCHRRPGGSIAISDLVCVSAAVSACVHVRASGPVCWQICETVCRVCL